MYNVGITAVVKYVFIQIIFQEPRTASSGWVIKLFFTSMKSILLSVFAMLSSFPTLLLPCCAYLLRRTLLQFVDLDVELLSSACHTNLLGPLLTCYNILWSSCYGVNITTRTFLTRIAHFSAGDHKGSEWVFFLRASLLVLDKLSNSMRHNMCSDLSQSWAPCTGFAF